MDDPGSNTQDKEIQLKRKPKQPSVNSGSTYKQEFVDQLRKSNIVNISDDDLTLKNLIDAYVYGNNNVVKQMLDQRKIDLNSLDSTGNSLLHNFILLYKIENIIDLYQRGANINLTNSNGETPLIVCCKTKTLTNSALQLIGMNADLNVRDNTGSTALHYACSQIPITMHESEENFELIKALIEKGAEPNILNDNLCYCLNTIENKLAEHILVKKGAEKFVLIKENALEVAFNEFLFKHKLIIPDLLMKFIEQRKNEVYKGETLLTFALQHKSSKLVSKLLELGCDITVPNDSKDTPIDLAFQQYNDIHEKFITFSCNKYVDGLPLLQYILKEKANMFDRSLEIASNIDGFDVNAPDIETKRTLLISVCLNNKLNSFLKIYNKEKRARVDFNHLDKFNRNVLFYLNSVTNSYMWFELLVENGASLDVIDSTGKSILSTYIKTSNINLVKAILKRMNTIEESEFDMIQQKKELKTDEIIQNELKRLVLIKLREEKLNQKCVIFAPNFKEYLENFITSSYNKYVGDLPLLQYILKEKANIFDRSLEIASNIDGFDVNAPDIETKRTLLISVCLNNKLDSFLKIYSDEKRARVDFNHLDKFNRNVLFYLNNVSSGFMWFELLVENGASLNVIDSTGKSILSTYIELPNINLVKTILRHVNTIEESEFDMIQQKEELKTDKGIQNELKQFRLSDSKNKTVRRKCPDKNLPPPLNIFDIFDL